MDKEAERINAEIHKEFDEILKDRKPKFNIGPKHLQFMGVDFLKPTCKNPKSRDEMK